MVYSCGSDTHTSSETVFTPSSLKALSKPWKDRSASQMCMSNDSWVGSTSCLSSPRVDDADDSSLGGAYAWPGMIVVAEGAIFWPGMIVVAERAIFVLRRINRNTTMTMGTVTSKTAQVTRILIIHSVASPWIFCSRLETFTEAAGIKNLVVLSTKSCLAVPGETVVGRCDCCRVTSW